MKKNKGVKSETVGLKKLFYRNKITGFKRMIAWMIVGGILASSLYSIKYLYTQYASANIDISLLYPEIANSNYPDKSRFTYYDLISQDKIERALEQMKQKGMYQYYTAAQIDSGLSIKARLGNSAKDAVSYQRAEGNDYSYVANEYKITFVQPHDYNNPDFAKKILTPDYSEVFLETLADVNKEEITNKYGGFDGFNVLVDKDKNSDYDYGEFVDVYRSKVNSAINYLNELENMSPGFVSKSTGMGIKDLVGEYKMLLSTRLDTISSYVDTAALSKDVQIASNKTKVNIENNKLKHIQYNDEVVINKNAEDKYDHTFTENLIVVTVHETNGLYQARPKTAFDTVVSQGLDATNNVHEYAKELRVLGTELENYTNAQVDSAEYDRLRNKCQTLIDEFYAKYNEVTDTARTVVSEYNESTNKAFLKIVDIEKDLISKSFIMKAGIVFALGASVLFVIYVVAGMHKERRNMKQRKRKLVDVRKEEA